LLLLDGLVNQLRKGGVVAGTTWERVAVSTARTLADDVVKRWGGGLRKAYRETPDLAFEQAVDLLVSMGLVGRDGSGLRVHAAAARYAPRPELVAGPAGQRSLFEEDE